MRVLTSRVAHAAFVALMLAGCGYSIRPPYDKGIKTIYVPIFRSQSFRKDINLMMTERLIKEINERTHYKVVNSPEAADAILEGFVTFVDKSVSVESPFNLPRHLNSIITLEVKFYDNRPGAPDKPPQGVIISDTAPFYPELGEGAMLGMQKSIDKIVRQIVGMMEDKW
jgi:lipopolysaccharide assembly LptE-like protein